MRRPVTSAGGGSAGIKRAQEYAGIIRHRGLGPTFSTPPAGFHLPIPREGGEGQRGVFRAPDRTDDRHHCRRVSRNPRRKGVSNGDLLPSAHERRGYDWEETALFRNPLYHLATPGNPSSRSRLVDS